MARVTDESGTADWARWNKVEKAEKRAAAREERTTASGTETTETTETPESPSVEQATFGDFDFESVQTSEEDDEQTTKDAARAEWEDFSFIPVTGGWVNVANSSYDDPKNHVYSVEVEDNEAVSCSCKHDTYRDGKCKHRRAVEADHL